MRDASSLPRTGLTTAAGQTSTPTSFQLAPSGWFLKCLFLSVPVLWPLSKLLTSPFSLMTLLEHNESQPRAGCRVEHVLFSHGCHSCVCMPASSQVAQIMEERVGCPKLDTYPVCVLAVPRCQKLFFRYLEKRKVNHSKLGIRDRYMWFWLGISICDSVTRPVPHSRHISNGQHTVWDSVIFCWLTKFLSW